MKKTKVKLLFIVAILGLLVLCSCEKNTINNGTEVFYDTQATIQSIKEEYSETTMSETAVNSSNNEDSLYISALEKINSYFGKYIAMNSDGNRIYFEETDIFDQSSEGGEITKFKDSDNNLIRCSRVLYGSIGNTEENYYLIGDSEVYFTQLEQCYDSYRLTDVTGTLNYYFSEYWLDGDKIYYIDRLNEQMVVCNENPISKSIQSMIEKQFAFTDKEYENTYNTETVPKSDITDISFDSKYENGLNKLFDIIETGDGGFCMILI